MMPNITKQCIICGSAENLNTIIGIVVSDTKISVAVCDNCSEDVTPKIVREAYTKKQEQIELVLAQARALGMELAPAANSNLVIATDTKVVRQQPKAELSVATAATLLEGDDVVSTSVLNRPMVSTGGAATFGNSQVDVPSHSSYNMNEFKSKSDVDLQAGKARLTMVEGRGGRPVALPSMIYDNTGVTRIRVVKTGDNELQQRFKNTAYESNINEGWLRPSFRDGYGREAGGEGHKCSICGGTGSIASRNGQELCPKCGGTGMM